MKFRKLTTGGFLFPRPGVVDPPIDVQRRMQKHGRIRIPIKETQP